MYTACTFRLANVLGLGFLEVIPRGFVYVALAAWTVVFIGWAGTMVRAWGGPAPQAPSPAAGATAGAE
jgi:hypothetical protein